MIVDNVYEWQQLTALLSFHVWRFNGYTQPDEDNQ